MIPRLAICVAGIAGFFIAPHYLAEYHLFQICLIAATALVVLGLVAVTGLAGQISLAQSAFVGLGGYGSAILATSWGVPLWASIPLTAFAGRVCRLRARPAHASYFRPLSGTGDDGLHGHRSAGLHSLGSGDRRCRGDAGAAVSYLWPDAQHGTPTFITSSCPLRPFCSCWCKM